MTAEHLLSVDDVAEQLGVAPSTLAKWRQTGTPDLPYLRINGRIRYRASDVDDFINEALDEETEDDADDYEDDDGGDEEGESDDE
jgi:hypothetical protein